MAQATKSMWRVLRLDGGIGLRRHLLCLLFANLRLHHAAADDDDEEEEEIQVRWFSRAAQEF